MRPVATAAVAAMAAVALGGGFAAVRSVAEAPKVVRIAAKRFEYLPPEIVLKKGVPVVLELVALDRTHGFKVSALGIRADVLADQVVRVPLTPDKAGRFVFACDMFCGDGHEDMEGHIIVEE